MRDRIDATVEKLPRWMGWLRGWLGRLNWEMKPRDISSKVDPKNIHDSVRERFKLKAVPLCAGQGPYRPEALREVAEFKQYYDGSPSPLYSGCVCLMCSGQGEAP